MVTIGKRRKIFSGRSKRKGWLRSFFLVLTLAIIGISQTKLPPSFVRAQEPGKMTCAAVKAGPAKDLAARGCK